MRGPTWTPQEIEAAQELIARDATDAECIATIGRGRHACYVKVSRFPDQKNRERRTFRMPRDDHQVRPAEELLMDARRRAMAPRSLTARLMGDPEPGRSALERRA